MGKQQLSDVEQLRAQEIIEELSECREDERASRNQIFTILTIVLALLTIAVAVLSGEKIATTKLQLMVNAFCTFMLCAAITHIANLGLLSTFRHFYVVELERKIHEIVKYDKDDFFHWESISTPLITFNYKKILSGLPMLYSINNAITFFSILLVAIIYVLFIQLFMESFNVFNIIICTYFWIVFLVVIFTMFVSSTKNSEIYKLVKEKASERREGRAKSSNYVKNNSLVLIIKYFIYPRIADIQKNLFLVFGFVMGCIVICFIEPKTIEFWKEAVKQFIFTWFIMDFLIYQARYQWNDIRGMFEDRNHPLKDKRKRLPETGFMGDRALLMISILIMIFRILTAVILIFQYAGESRNAFFMCIFMLLVISIAYEYVRMKKTGILILFFVSLGYPLRFMMGFVGACTCIDEIMQKYPLLIIAIVFILISAALFGEVFVSLTWLHEAIYLIKQGKPIKFYYNILIRQVDTQRIDKQFPMEYRDKIKTIWNTCFILSMSLLLVAILCVINDSSNKFHLITILFNMTSTMLTILIGQKSECKKKKCFQLILYMILGLEILLAIWKLDGIARFLYIFLCVQRISYSITYVMFRGSNYESLTSFGEDVSFKIKKLILGIIKMLFGEDVYNILVGNP